MNFLPIQINEAQLEALSITDGQLIFVKDKPAIYLDAGETRYSILLKATESTAGIVQPDNDTIKVNDGVISADVIGNWSAGVSYPVGYFVVYGEGIWECMVKHTSTSVFDESKWMPVAFRAIKVYNWGANTDYYLYQFVIYNNMLYRAKEKHTSSSAFDESKWDLISGNTTGTGINNWTTNTEYTVGNLIINGTTIYQCNTAHTSGETFDETNWTAMTGAKGDKGEDGVTPETIITDISNGKRVTFKYTYEGGLTQSFSADIENGVTPHIDETTKNWFVGETDTNVKAEGVDGITPEIDDTTKHWFIDGEDTGVIAEGTVEINTDCAILYATFLANGWSDTAPYTQTVTVNSITVDNVPIVDISYSEDTTLWESEKIAYSCLTKLETIDNGVIGYCLGIKPENDFTVKLKIAGDINGLTVVTQSEFDELKAQIDEYNVILEDVLNGNNYLALNTSLENTLNGVT